MTNLQLLDHFRKLCRYATALRSSVFSAYEADQALVSMMGAERKAIEIAQAEAERELERRNIPYR